MRVDFQFANMTWSYLHYNQFSVGSANEECILTVGGFTGVGRDLFAAEPHHGMKFSTADNDNDLLRGNCAAKYKSGWWYNDCFHTNINHWPPYYNHPSTAVFSEIKIRHKGCSSNN